MSLADLTDPAAVRQALAEFDALGRDVFLAKYGFRPARGYFLVDQGRPYDSKAVAGAAHGYQFPGRPLRARDFSGGDATVRSKLESLGFEVLGPQEKRNPSWTRDELILALDLYMRHRPSLPAKTGREISDLSILLNRLRGSATVADSGRFRNLNGVYLKLTNFRSLDPDYKSQGKVGMQHGGRGDEEVWDAFAEDPERLRATAIAIREAIEAGETIPTFADDDEDDDFEAEEGRLLTVQHHRRERNRKLVDKCKRRALKRDGRLRCEACAFDFLEAYGERGRGFIECHHTRPVHTLRPGDRTKVDELALVCANCHRMIHARRPWLVRDGVEVGCRSPKTARRTCLAQCPPGSPKLTAATVNCAAAA